ncbi:MAG: metallophosphoesterase [Desulfobaccales bacterium]
MAKRLIFSDLHFGDPLCSFRKEAVTTGLRQFLRKDLRQVEELILAGDVLDANISTLTKAIGGQKEPGTWPRQMGFRAWLDFLLEGDEFTVGKIIYLPGNHDYIIWNILSTDRAFVQPISAGTMPGKLPLMNGVFPDAFIRGIAPGKIQNSFVVKYPDHEFSLAQRNVLVTHGHYFDEQQTLFKSLDELIEKAGGDKAKASKIFFIGAAQYQMIANAFSYLQGSREFVHKTYRTLSYLLDKINIFGKLKNKPINKAMLRAIEMYLSVFYKNQPDVVIFGHTHAAGRSSTQVLEKRGGKRLLDKVMEVWNIGSFIENPGENRAGSFILTDDEAPANGKISLFEVKLSGDVQRIL